MVIPLGTDRPLRRPALVTPVLVALNIAIYLAQAIFQRVNPAEYQSFLAPFLIDPNHFRPWQPITYAFLHADWLHLLGNMLFLWVFGVNVEDRLTRPGFVAFYLIGGAAAAGAHALLDDNPALGASGAIAAVTGAYIVLFPRTHVKSIIWFLIIGIVHIPAWVFILFAIVKDIVFAGVGDGSVAYFAHLGGYFYGMLVSLTLLWRRVLAREPYDLFTIGKQAYRRRQFREQSFSVDRAEARAPVRRAAEDPESSPAATARAEVASFLAQSRLADAATAYKLLVERHADTPQLCTLSRRHQLDLANHYFTTADHVAAAYAYDRFLETYPRDTETPRVRLLLGLINARYLNDPVRARQLLTGLAPSLPDAEQRSLTETLLTELG